jgi:antitoxin component of MazEF toxin-antitoxin module
MNPVRHNGREGYSHNHCDTKGHNYQYHFIYMSNGVNRKIFKTGHSAAVTLSKKLLDELGLRLGDNVRIEPDKDKNQFIIRPGNRENQLALDIHTRPRLGQNFKRNR